ncbi:putative addiction module component, TIGR02574 family [Enhydrobacter aerosaccus]|uniref:Putative addiction module component, TIGR02574 family n=1 Tax=Enhydrobacter aerosaccus TaxID=225324 RepID=A0A1T4QMD5_9HYPH|nr:hypothetical protein [Enhydrobacter aerosaccus]SKA04923.1 putative addiction module component, TIGR02574 family [Enhydrobacter aerosaccus]
MDRKSWLHELQQLPAQERVDIAWALLDGVSDDEAARPLSVEQRRELSERQRDHFMNPNEPTVTLDQIRRKLLAG